ncbi:MAG: YdiU family protein [Acidimicrobiia bacterium]|nr:YdiU family protein [Acidimicrobiia bacterium]
MTTATLELAHSYADELPEMGVVWQAGPTSAPQSIVVNHALADELGLDNAWLESPSGLGLLVGNALPEGTMPVAMAYSGHQFGGYSPLLGDGRALLLGELTRPDGSLVDIHLKGSGRTPFARGGDGRATLPAMLREFLIAEAMHALGVSTTRALAVVATGDDVVREGPTAGAVLTRLASSHLRVGSFQYAAAHDDSGDLGQRLADYAIERHYPALLGRDDRYLAFLESVLDAQAALIAQWMLTGFIHGVMNTDNMLISGETIDYGPCAFLDRFDPATVYSSIDRGGRYAFGNQPAIAQWNLTRLAETLLDLIDDDQDAAIAAATVVLETFPDRYVHHWRHGMQAKLGLSTETASDAALFDDLLNMMHDAKADYTLTFRSLSDLLRGDASALRSMIEDPRLDAWATRWCQRLDDEGATLADVATAIDRINPLYIPRNHLVEAALDAAGNGDLSPFTELLDVVTSPFDIQERRERYATPPGDAFSATYQTFCGT